VPTTRLILAILLCLSPVSSAQDAREYQRQAFDAFEAGDYALAESNLREQLELTPDDFVPHYNLACALSMQRRTDEAAAALQVAVAKGFSDLVQLEHDPYLADARETTAVRDLIDRWDAIMSARAAAEFEHLRESLGPSYVYQRDDNQRMIYACAFGAETLAQARAELDKVTRFGLENLFPELAETTEADAWVSVILPNREDYLKWAVSTFGPGAVSGMMGVGGQYSHDRKQLVCQDLGPTFRHEFLHALQWRHATRLGQHHPIWIQEGLASLVEDLDEVNGRVVPVPSWRTNIAKRLARSGHITPIEKIPEIPRPAFTQSRALARYAEVRALFLYLYDTGRLLDFYTAFTENYKNDPTGVETLRTTLGGDWRTIERDYRAWLRNLEEVPEEIDRGMASIGVAIEPGSGDGPIVANVVFRRTGLDLIKGDVITAIDGRPTRDMGELVRVLADYQPGQIVTLRYRRGSRHGTTQVTLVPKR